jgi:tetratricopeptide (TPR) repeat protein
MKAKIPNKEHLLAFLAFIGENFPDRKINWSHLRWIIQGLEMDLFFYDFRNRFSSPISIEMENDIEDLISSKLLKITGSALKITPEGKAMLKSLGDDIQGRLEMGREAISQALKQDLETHRLDFSEGAFEDWKHSGGSFEGLKWPRRRPTKRAATPVAKSESEVVAKLYVPRPFNKPPIMVLNPPAETAPANVWFDYGNILYNKQDFDGDIDAYHKVIEKDGTREIHTNAWNNLGNALQLERDFDGAIDAYNNAIEIDPSFELAKQNLAGCQFRAHTINH